MCIYAYHHYPLCGHVSHFTVVGCQEFTNQLRLVAKSDEITSCNDAKSTHDLLSSEHPDLCLQCEYEWGEAMVSNGCESLTPNQYRTIEGLDAKKPFIKFFARMTGYGRNENASSPISALSADDEQYDTFFEISQECERDTEGPYLHQTPDLPQRWAPVAPLPQTNMSDGRSSLFYLNLSTDTDATSEVVPFDMDRLDVDSQGTPPFESGMETSSRINLLGPLPSREELYADRVKALKETPTESRLNTSSISSETPLDADVSSQEETNDPTEDEQSYATDDSLWRASMSDVSSVIFPPHTAYEWIPDLDLAGIAIARGLIDWQPLQNTLAHQCESADEDEGEESALQASFSSDESEGGCPLEFSDLTGNTDRAPVNR